VKLTAEIVSGFVNSVLSKGFDEATESPEFHHELWKEACSPHRFIAIAAPRGHAKSTAGTLAYGLAEVLFRTSRYVLVVSDTETQATMFVSAMAQALSTNEDLIELFGIKKNDKGKVEFLKTTESDIIVEFTDGATFRIAAKGAQQSLRGLLWNGLRPDLILIDDLENDELVMNKERREKLKRWFRAALIPMLSRKGKIRYWGTILHMDALLENLMPAAYDKYTVDTGLKIYSINPKKQMWRGIKYKAHNADMSQFLWPTRYPKEYWKEMYIEFAGAGTLDLYNQEYLNNPIDETTAYFKRSDFLSMAQDDEKKQFHYYVSVDLAISQEARADYSVFCVAGVDENRTIHLLQVIRDRLDAKEIVDLLLALQRTYEPEAFGIEKMMVSQAIGPFLREEMVRQDTYLNIVEISHQGKDKPQRARNIQARMRARTCKFNKSADWYPAFEDELLKFPRGMKDDQVDSWAYMGTLLDKMIEAPTKDELEDDAFRDEFRASGLSFAGRNRTTGY